MNYFEVLAIGGLKTIAKSYLKSFMVRGAEEQTKIAQWYQIEGPKEMKRHEKLHSEIINGKEKEMRHWTAPRTIVVTPIEIVDFSVRSSIQQSFKLAENKQDWLNRTVFHDYFAGSGIFMARLMRMLVCEFNVHPQIIKQLWEDGRFENWELSAVGAYCCKVNLEREYRKLVGSSPRVPANVQCRDTFDVDPRHL